MINFYPVDFGEAYSFENQRYSSKLEGYLEGFFMKWKNFKLWMGLFAIILVIGAILYQQSRNNRDALQSQAIKGVEIARKNFLIAFDAYHLELESFLQRRFIALSNSDGKSQKIAKSLDSLFQNNVPDVYELYQTDPESKVGIEHKVLLDKRNGSVLLDQNFDLGTKLTEVIGQYISQGKNKINPTGFRIPNNVTEEGSWLVTSYIPLEKLMKKEKDNLFFDKILLADSVGKAIYPQEYMDFQVLDFDKIQAQDTVKYLKTGAKISEIGISDVTYLVFWMPIELHGQKLFLLGIKEKGQFDKVGLRLNFNLLVTLVFGLVFLLISIPILSLLNLDKGDILSKAKIYGMGLSLMVLMIVFGFGLSFQKNLERYVLPEEDNFKSIVTHYNNLFNRFEGLLLQARKTETSKTIWNDSHLIELLEIQDKKLNKLHIGLPDLSNPDLKRAFDFNGESFIDISKRTYVSGHDRKENKGKIVIEAHYSLGSGKLESVISKKRDSLYIDAVTFNLDIPEDSIHNRFSFLIFKKDGRVIHKSEKITTPLDNLEDALPSYKWKEIQTLMSENGSVSAIGDYWEIPLYLNGQPYIGILQLLDKSKYDQPIWTLFLINKNITYVRSSLTSLESIGFLMFYLLFLISISGLNFVYRKKSKVLLFVPFVYDWLYPAHIKSRRYFLLIGFNMYYLLLFLLLYVFSKGNMVNVTLFSALIAIQSAGVLFLLAGPNWHKGNVRDDKGYILALTIVSIVLLYLLFKNSNFGYLGILVFIPLAYSFLSKGLDAFSWLDRLSWTLFKKHKYFYVGYMFSWTFLVGFVPGFSIHSSTAKFENIVWELGDLSDSQIKNLQGNSDFINIDWLQSYEKYRRNLFSLTADAFDSRIERFVSAQRNKLNHALQFSDNRERKNLNEIINNPWLFRLSFLAVLLIMYFLISELVRKVYLTDFVFNKHQSIIKENGHLVNPPRVFLCSLDTNKKIEWVKNNLSEKNLEYTLVTDIIKNPDQEDIKSSLSGKKVWLVENIHCLPDISKLSENVVKWDGIATEANVKLVLGSGKSWKELTKSLGEEKANMIVSEIFSDYFFEFVPLDYSEKGDEKEQKERIKAFSVKEYGKNNFDSELSFGPNLNDVKNLIESDAFLDFENKLLLIQRYNKAYYANIWAELSFAEKKVCYYFAKETFLNHSNWDTITELVQKGVLSMNPKWNKLELFNQTFRHFILSYITDKEIQEFRKDEKLFGNSKTIEISGISFVLLALAMIGYFDKSFLNEAYAYVSGFFGVLGSLYSMFNKSVNSLSFLNKSSE